MPMVILTAILCAISWMGMLSSAFAADTLAAPGHTLYSKECGSCHMAYPPELLPARSWHTLLANLQNHFGENAALPEDDTRALTAYVMAHAADRSPSKLATKIMHSLRRGESPQRISEVPYIQRKHREIPQRLIADNPEVKSLSQCNKCHARAQEGSFREREILIPGHGRWDD